MRSSTTIVWFRYDLRIEDNPALYEAAMQGAVVPLFIWAPEEEAPWNPGEASKWWLHQSLNSLQNSLQKRGSQLILRQGNALQALKGAIQETGAGRVFWNRRYESKILQRDAEIKTKLADLRIEIRSFNSALLYEPWEVKTLKEEPYKVFTPFWKAAQNLPAPAEPLPTLKQFPAPDTFPKSDTLESLRLKPKLDWAGGLREAWVPGERGAKSALKAFETKAVERYSHGRDRPGQVGASRLSPYLHFGEISPRQVWHSILSHQSKSGPGGSKSHWAYLRELGWREFAHHILFHFPHTAEQPMRPEFSRFPWKDDNAALARWQKGRTGYPIVDAGMRELWETGWMHNRARMIAASFLAKDLLIPWQEGARWFWDTLVDADLANNSMGWQWTAGCGADAAPYFRIFNPVLQGEKFDAEGEYVRRWVPELKALAKRWIHQPWKAPEQELMNAGIKLGDTYPKPIVDHSQARGEALEAYQRIKRKP